MAQLNPADPVWINTARPRETGTADEATQLTARSDGRPRTASNQTRHASAAIAARSWAAIPESRRAVANSGWWNHMSLARSRSPLRAAKSSA